jgi:predicted amidohydrolase
LINDSGAIIDRYDKRFCGGDRDERSGDLAHYSAGDHPSVFTIRGVRCGAQICYDYRFPELYREYEQLGVQLMFHSFHAAHVSPSQLAVLGSAIGNNLPAIMPGSIPSYPGITMPAAMTSAAANNYMWISCPNSSAPESLWPSFFVRADGVTTGRLRRNIAGVLVSEVDTAADLYDSTVAWRDRAVRGVLHSGTLLKDPRSAERTRL